MSAVEKFTEKLVRALSKSNVKFTSIEHAHEMISLAVQSVRDAKTRQTLTAALDDIVNAAFDKLHVEQHDDESDSDAAVADTATSTMQKRRKLTASDVNLFDRTINFVENDQILQQLSTETLHSLLFTEFGSANLTPILDTLLSLTSASIDQFVIDMLELSPMDFAADPQLLFGVLRFALQRNVASQRFFQVAFEIVCNVKHQYDFSDVTVDLFVRWFQSDTATFESTCSHLLVVDTTRASSLIACRVVNALQERDATFFGRLSEKQLIALSDYIASRVRTDSLTALQFLDRQQSLICLYRALPSHTNLSLRLSSSLGQQKPNAALQIALDQLDVAHIASLHANETPLFDNNLDILHNARAAVRAALGRIEAQQRQTNADDEESSSMSSSIEEDEEEDDVVDEAESTQITIVEKDDVVEKEKSAHDELTDIGGLFFVDTLGSRRK